MTEVFRMKIVKILASSAIAFGMMMGSALAETDQTGLVNVNVEGNTVQVPISVAANVCDVDVAVLVSEYEGTDKVACEIDQETAAEHNIEY
jgi:hypothetical protein